jgi:pimeloyl-ACP methyl ester carboxylesterase
MSDNAVEISPKHREAAGLAIRYAESEGGAGETVLLLSPWPESLFAWNSIWSSLAQTARLVAIDLPGFGQSEAPGRTAVAAGDGSVPAAVDR